MEDSDDIRRLVEARLKALGLDAAVVSVRMGKNRGYLHDYLKKRSPKMMPQEVKIALAREIQVPPQRLGVSYGDIPSAGGFHDDATPYQGTDDFSYLPPNLAPFVMKTRALDKHPRKLVPGTVVVMDLNVVDPREIATGEVVIVQVFDTQEVTRHFATIFRQFIAPDKLVTNSSGPNDIASLNDPADQFKFVIKGVLKYIFVNARNGQTPHRTSNNDA